MVFYRDAGKDSSLEASFFLACDCMTFLVASTNMRRCAGFLTR